MTYTQVWDYARGQVSDSIIQRDEDNAFIPFDPDNTDYQAYLAWLDEGNQPTPYTQPVHPEGETDGATPEPHRDPARSGARDEHSRPAEPRATVTATGGGHRTAPASEHSRPATPTKYGSPGGSSKRPR